MTDNAPYKVITDVAGSIKAIGSQIDLLTSKGNIQECNEKLSSIESAKLGVSTAYTLATLYFMYLKLHGIPTTNDNHPIHSELNRIKTYVEKVNKADITKRNKRNTVSIDSKAAKRIINFELNDNNKEENDHSNISKKLKVQNI